MYGTAILIIPLTIVHRMWHNIQDKAGINLATFNDMTDPGSDIMGMLKHGKLNNILL
jgi:hypothetical protein